MSKNLMYFHSQRTLTMFVGVVTLRYQHHITECHNSHKHSQSPFTSTSCTHVSLRLPSGMECSRASSRLFQHFSPHIQNLVLMEDFVLSPLPATENWTKEISKLRFSPKSTKLINNNMLYLRLEQKYKTIIKTCQGILFTKKQSKAISH